MTDVELLEATDEEQAYQAREAQHLLSHAAIKAAFLATESRIIRQWKAADNPLAREMCWHKLNAFKDLQTELRAFGERPPLTVTK